MSATSACGGGGNGALPAPDPAVRSRTQGDQPCACSASRLPACLPAAAPRRRRGAPPARARVPTRFPRPPVQVEAPGRLPPRARRPDRPAGAGYSSVGEGGAPGARVLRSQLQSDHSPGGEQAPGERIGAPPQEGRGPPGLVAACPLHRTCPARHPGAGSAPLPTLHGAWPVRVAAGRPRSRRGRAPPRWGPTAPPPTHRPA